MNLQKSDVLVSVGIILDSSVKVESIKNLHEHLNTTYNYFEILLLKQPESNLDSSLNNASINNNFPPPPPIL